jgi:hypothetical protein
MDTIEDTPIRALTPPAVTEQANSNSIARPMLGRRSDGTWSL